MNGRLIRRVIVVVVSALIGAGFGVGGAAAETDTEAPVLTNFSLSPTTVQPTQYPAGTSWTLDGTDNFPTGLCFNTRVRFTAPSGHWIETGMQPGDSGLTPTHQQGGMSWNPGAEAGDWAVSVKLGDCQSNTRDYTSAQLIALGFPGAVTVLPSEADVTPPTLTNFTITPTTIQPTQVPASAGWTLDGTDDFPRGLCFSTRIRFTAPSGRWIETGMQPGDSGITPTHQEGGASWGPGSEAGDWAITVHLSDCQGVFRDYSSADLIAMGFPGVVTVLPSPADTTPPTLTNFTLSRTSVRPITSFEGLQWALDGTDNFPRGLCFSTHVVFTSPTGDFAFERRMRPGDPGLTPTHQEGFISFGPDDEKGDWTVTVHLSDCQGVFRDYSSAELIAMGFPGVVTVLPPNDPPVALDDSYTVDHNTTLSVPALGVLANDTDPESDPLSATIGSAPAHGSLTLNDDGSFGYTPTSGYSGPDSFTYTASDGQSGSSTADVALTVLPRPNTAPTANGDVYALDQNTSLHVATPGLLGNDSDAEGDTLTVIAASAPLNGVAVVTADGSFSYTPNAGFSGSDSLSYTVDDGHGGSATAVVSLTVVKTLNYEGPAAVKRNGSFEPKAKLSSVDPACVGGRMVTFTLDVNPITGAAGPYSLGSASAVAPSGQATAPSVSTKNWNAGSYTVTAHVATAPGCTAAVDAAPLKVGK